MRSPGDLLHKQIIRQGPVSFENFMETALYCPEVGYYERGHASVGQRGDFCTSVSVGPAFGRLLAADFARRLVELGEKPFQLVETGAHDGQLAADILTAWRDVAPDSFQQVQYWLVEPSPRRRQWQEEKLAAFRPQVQWVSALSEIPEGVRGIIFSNELLDAFPVRRLGWDAAAKRWFEWGVGWSDDHFTWARMPLAPGGENFPYADAGLDLTALERAQLEAVLPDGFVLELNPRAARWWRDAAEQLRAGWLMAFDYGLPAEELLRAERPQGTVRAYRQQRYGDDVLAEPGAQDLTAHVNFTAIERAGIAAGLRTEVFETQERFLSHVLAAELRQEPARVWSADEMRQMQSLIHPAHFGRSFRVLVQRRG
jgi:SAM-dependent MidA family methyltransferase